MPRNIWCFFSVFILHVIYLELSSPGHVFVVGEETVDKLLNLSLKLLCPDRDLCYASGFEDMRHDGYTNSGDIVTNISCCAPCSCNTDCQLYGDCCPTLNNTVQQPPCKDTFYNVDNDFRQEINGINKGYHMYNIIQSCGNNYNKTKMLYHKCISTTPQVFEDIAVVSDDAGLVYRNSFCARCNGVSKYTQWNVKTECGPNVDILNTYIMDFQLLVKSSCKVWSEPTDPFKVERSRCYKPDVTVCYDMYQQSNTNNTLIETLCGSFIFPYFEHVINSQNDSKTIVYKNVYCLLCNTNESIFTMADQCAAAEGMVKADDTVPFVAVINMDATDESLIKDNDLLPCRNHSQVYDSFVGTCKELHCLTGSFPSHGKCVKMYKEVEGAVFQVLYMIRDDWVLTYVDTPLEEWSRRISQDVGLAQIGCGICTTTFRSAYYAYYSYASDIVVEYHTTQSCTIQAAADVLNKVQLKFFTTDLADDGALVRYFDIMVVDPFDVLQNYSNFNNSDVKTVLKSCHNSKYRIYGLSCPNIYLSMADYERYPVDRLSSLLVLPYMADQLYGNDTLYNMTVDSGTVDICLTDFLTLETVLSASVVSNEASTFELKLSSAILLVPLTFTALIRIRKCF